MRIAWGALSRECLYGLIASAFVARYYGLNPRHTGLLGPGAFGVWRERLGFGVPFNKVAEARPVWVHAAGPGDARAATAFVRALRRSEEDVPVFVTAGSTRGFEYLSEQLGDSAGPVHWLPFDLPHVVRRYLRRVRPGLFVGAQGEFWPNLLKEFRRVGVPCVFLRVDVFDWEAQAEFPRCLLPLYRHMLSHVDRFSVRSPMDMQRLEKLGVADSRIIVGGDYRIEVVGQPTDERSEELARLFSVSTDCPLVILANPRVDEIRAVASRLSELVTRGSIRLLIAPTAADVVRRAARHLRRQGLGCSLFSELTEPVGPKNIVILDTHGVLYHAYACASAAIIGDTFSPAFSIGANLWEPLLQGCPVLHGPEFRLTTPMQPLRNAGFLTNASCYENLAGALANVLASGISRDEIRSATSDVIKGEPSASSIDVECVLRMPGNPFRNNILHQGSRGMDRLGHSGNRGG